MSKTIDLRKNCETLIKPELASNATVNNVAASLTEVLIAPANSLRREIVIHNNSNGTLYIICGSGVTATNYSYKLSRQDYVIIDTYRGQINAIGTSASGFYMVTEKFY